MKAAPVCQGDIHHSFGAGHRGWSPCDANSKWRVEWLAEPKAGQPKILHLMTACSAHLVQVLTQAKAMAVCGEVHVLSATNDYEWWSELAD